MTGERTQQVESERERASPLSLSFIFFSVSKNVSERGLAPPSCSLRDCHCSSRSETVSLFDARIEKMPPQQRPPPSNARAVDAEASAGLRMLALQFEATGKWAQVRKAKELKMFSLDARRRFPSVLDLVALTSVAFPPLSHLFPGNQTQAVKCYDACLAIAADEPRVEASVRLACARLLLRHTEAHSTAQVGTLHPVTDWQA